MEFALAYPRFEPFWNVKQSEMVGIQRPTRRSSGRGKAAPLSLSVSPHHVRIRRLSERKRWSLQSSLFGGRRNCHGALDGGFAIPNGQVQWLRESIQPNR